MYLIKFVVVIFVVSSLQLFCLYVEGSIHKINYYSCLHARLIGQHLTSTSDFYARSSYTISTVGSFTISPDPGGKIRVNEPVFVKIGAFTHA